MIPLRSAGKSDKIRRSALTGLPTARHLDVSPSQLWSLLAAFRGWYEAPNAVQRDLCSLRVNRYDARLFPVQSDARGELRVRRRRARGRLCWSPFSWQVKATAQNDAAYPETGGFCEISRGVTFFHLASSNLHSIRGGL